VAATLGDLIQIIDEQSYLGEKVLNIYYYRIITIAGLGSDYLELVADWFEDNVIAAVVQEQIGQLSHDLISTRNLSNGIDFYEKPIDTVGTLTADANGQAPSYVSLGFKLIRESLVTRNGYKRFSGLADARIQGNTYFGDEEDIAAIEDALAADIVIGAVSVAEPVIVKRPLAAAPIASYEYSSIGSSQMVGLGSQNTRKPGRGD